MPQNKPTIHADVPFHVLLIYVAYSTSPPLAEPTESPKGHFTLRSKKGYLLN
jgi:hypothetical protein